MEEVKRKRGRPPKKKEPIVEEETQIIQEEVEDNEELSSTDEKLTPKKHLREFRLDSVENINEGDELKADTFTAGDQLNIKGT